MTEIESSVVYKKVLHENKTIVKFGIIIYFLILFSILLVQAQTITASFTPFSFSSIYAGYFKPNFYREINLFYFIGIIPAIGVSAFFTSALSGERQGGEIVSIISLIILLSSLIILSLIELIFFTMMGDDYNMHKTLEILIGILIFTIIPLSIFHLGLGWFFGLLGVKISG